MQNTHRAPAHTVCADDVRPQPWRNGGGQTRELLVWPSTGDWQVRISRADIAADGPFSAFAGVQRWFAVISGAGVRLHFAEQNHTLGSSDAPLAFDGALAPNCTLIAGATQDLNLMARHGVSQMQRVDAEQGWAQPFALRALYTGVDGVWRDGQGEMRVAAHTLLYQWSDTPDQTATVWQFQPQHLQPAQAATTLAAWWMGYTPDIPLNYRLTTGDQALMPIDCNH